MSVASLERPIRCWGAALLLLAAAPGCKRLATGAKDEFVKNYSCPPEQVRVTPRSDVKAADLFDTWHPGTPSAEVAADPGRLAFWRAQQEKIHQSMRDRYSREDVYQVVGCGHDVLFACEHHHYTPPGGGKGVSFSIVDCDAAPSPKH